MTAPSTSLEHCALLFATPVSREEFDRACLRTPRSDYIAHLVVSDPEEIWVSDYAKVASTAQELIETARALGAVIIREATLADFAYATAHFSIVILLAHFRGFDYSKEDLIGPVARVVAAIDGQSHPALAYFAPAPHEPDLLIDALNAGVFDRKLLSYLPQLIGVTGLSSIPVGRVLCRDLLDEALDGLVRPGNKIDLHDGLHSLGEAEAAMWHGFRGELDLALCNSVAFATYIDLRRHNIVRHLHWPDLIDPIPQFLLIAETLRRVSRRQGSYIKARLELESEMLQLDWSDDDSR